MRKSIQIIISVFFVLFLTSMELHKFYVSVSQINFVPTKKALEITSRIFIDDLDLALEKKFKKKVYLATPKEVPDSKELLQKYFNEKFQIKINGQIKPIQFLGKEEEENVFVCYFRVKEVEKITTLEIKNTLLMEHYDQQNIFHTNILGQKKSFVLTTGTTSEVLKY